MERQLSCSENEDTGYRHSDEKLDQRKPISFFFFESEKKNHLCRPSIAELSA